MSATPLFSIIIPTFNEEKFLPNLLASLDAQTYRSFEVIVVDGKSKDKTVALAKAFQKTVPGLTILTDVGPGISVQRNAGAKHANGEWFVFIDADGEVLPYFLERLAWYIDIHTPQLVTTWFAADGQDPNDALVTLFLNAVVESSILLKRPFTPGPLTIVPRDLFFDVGGYDETREYGEDYDLGAKVYKKGIPLSVLRETLCVYSLRRMRNEGKFKWFQANIKAALSVLVTNKSPRSMSGYIMGGHLYKKKKIERSAWKKFQGELQKIVKDLLD